MPVYSVNLKKVNNKTMSRSESLKRVNASNPGPPADMFLHSRVNDGSLRYTPVNNQREKYDDQLIIPALREHSSPSLKSIYKGFP